MRRPSQHRGNAAAKIPAPPRAAFLSWQAHAELGEGARTFHTALRDGLRRLAETPVPDGPITVIARGGVYAFADARLEALSPAQKPLLRSGPDNARRVQAQLAAIAAAIGSGN